jgi:hypothetical protein
MIRTLLLGMALVFGCAVLAAPAGADDKAPGGKVEPPYVHAVFFYLKKDAPKGEVESLIADTHEMLGKIPSVRKLWVGRPAEKSTPKFARTDYQVGLLVLFDNFDGLKEYLDHPRHTEYVKKHEKHWDTVPVYDFVNQKK